MATSQVAPGTTAAVGSGTASTTGETIVVSHDFTIDGFSSTKDVGVGKSIRSSIFRVGGHDWYIKCYPCGDDEESAGWVSLFLCRQDDDHDSRVSGWFKFTLMETLEDGCLKRLIGHPAKSFIFPDDDEHQRPGTDFIKRKKLESLLKDDCFRVRCTVGIAKFPAVPQQDLDNETVAGSHVLTIDDYSKTREAYALDDAIESCSFRVGGLCWYIQFYPCGEDENEADGITTYLCLDEDAGADYEVKLRFEITLLTHAGQIISSLQNLHTFRKNTNAYDCYFLGAMEHESSPLLQDSIHIRCDMAIVDGITAMPNLRRGIGGDLELQGSQHVRVRGDVTFEVGGHLFAAHKCVLTTRCAALMAEIFRPPGKENADVTNLPVRIDHMEPRVFEALLHFIYTDALPDLSEEGKVGIAQGLLVVADRYAMYRLKMICGDLLCSYVTNARTAVTTLDLADKHGIRRLKEACMKFLMDHFVNVAP